MDVETCLLVVRKNTLNEAGFNSFRNCPKIVKASIITLHYAIARAIFVSKRRQSVARQQGWSLKRAPAFQACDRSVVRRRTLTRPSHRDTFVVLKPVVNNDELVPARDYTWYRQNATILIYAIVPIVPVVMIMFQISRSSSRTWQNTRIERIFHRRHDMSICIRMTHATNWNN